MILFSHFFISWQFSIKNLQLLRICPFRFLSILSSKYVLFWILVFKTILILIKFPFQWYINCRHLNFDATYENGRHGDFPPFWKSGILGLVDHFVVCIKIFLEFTRSSEKVKQEFSFDSNTFTRLYYRTGTIQGSISSFPFSGSCYEVLIQPRYL